MIPSNVKTVFTGETQSIGQQSPQLKYGLSGLDQAGIRLVTNDLVNIKPVPLRTSDASLQFELGLTEVSQKPIDSIAEQIESTSVKVQAARAATLSEPPAKHISFKPLEQWIGEVEEISEIDLSFTAKVKSRDPQVEPERGEFKFDELSEDDRALVEPGAMFYWSIGYQVEPSGQRSVSSIIRFRRLPIWKEKEIQDAKRRANSRVSWFFGNTDAVNHAA